MYLQQDSWIRIIYRDLKASNISLDTHMNPKISDFDLARSFGGNETGAKTGRVVGTYGYMSPKYVLESLFSLKSDVFSFGDAPTMSIVVFILGNECLLPEAKQLGFFSQKEMYFMPKILLEEMQPTHHMK
ncbi:G-type lectin S-receptor-like serine/threonine-protein kinase At4g03230 [Olea europaea var. sylvestris]|uniref:G-type lectin S-receptor-like serine/threonine-protein kinase At4g03230 n=1 Tax=Olea europaea var. sylvestris TaxID=158386 RepID=UPI000C1CF751|nr:G-type lectin S-receptor-like serine/threonine-protein kinase At4g03230 [Olea europaea var. sylvestris]